MRYHFSGVGGAGMSPLARLLASRGYAVQGSDRAFDAGHKQAERDELVAAGVEVLPHDGQAITAAVDCCVHSAAVEADTPELRRARDLAVPCLARSQLLHQVVAEGRPGVAVAGTSGKSSVVGMLAWICRCLEHPATILGGAPLALGDTHHMGCFVAGGSQDPVIAEACESDGSLVGYRPAIGLIHNISRDHDELDGLRAQFAAFAVGCARLLVNAACPVARAVGADHPAVSCYGGPEGLEIRTLGPQRAQGRLVLADGRPVDLDLPQPGRHQVDNAAAALAVAAALGLDPVAAAAALSSYPGIARRFQCLGHSPDGIRVIDDYAHNADKIQAAVAAARLAGGRLLTVFQPHGYGPARFLRAELKALWPRILGPEDRLCYAPIYDAGGTVRRDISAADLAADLPGLATCVADHQTLLDWVASTVRPGDTVLIMGARDPALGHLARRVWVAVGNEGED